MTTLTDTYYDLDQLLENEKGWLFYEAAFKAWRAVYKHIAGRSALDIGCGSGIMMALTRVFQPDLEVVGIEGGDSCRPLWEKRGLDVRVGNVFELPFADGSFDTVYSSHVLEHLVEPSLLVKEMERVARKRVINIVPDGDVNAKNFGSPHLHIFNRKNFLDLYSGSRMRLVDHFGISDTHMNQLVSVHEKT